MAGRRGQPIDIVAARGKKHLTKEEKNRRKKGEIKLGSGKITCPMYVYSDKVAHKKWNELMADYNKSKVEGIDLMKSSDAGILAMYCKTFSEYQELLKSYQRVSEIHYDCKELDEALDGDYYDEEDDKVKVLFSYKVKKQLRDLFSINAILTIETAINRKMDMLLKMEDRLFLNPLAKVRNVPKAAPKKADPLGDQGFGNV
jgi:phage terminase small subunit